jgi:hypothetical protein
MRETRIMIGDLAPMIGRRLSFGVVPDWHGEWPLAAYPDYCSLVQESSADLLLHGYFHRRRRGSGPAAWLTAGADELSGLDAEETKRTLERGQRVFTEVFGQPARGFLAPAWQLSQVNGENCKTLGVEYLLGFFSVESAGGKSIPLATWSWDCGRWAWLGHVGHGVGWLLHSLDRGVPVLAIHPRDLERGFWPKILRVVEELLARRYEPLTVTGLLDAE